MDSSEEMIEQLRLLKEAVERIAEALDGAYDRQKRVLRVALPERANRPR